MARSGVVVGLTALTCAVAMGAVSACTSFSTEDGSGQADATGGEDRTVPPAGDGSVDATADQDDAARLLTACTGVDATFCDDFDRGEALSKRWKLNPVVDNALLEVSDARALSAPASLRIMQATDAAFGALLTAAVPTFVERFFMSFDILFVDLPTGGTYLVDSHLTPDTGEGNQTTVVGPLLAAYPPTNVKEGVVELRADNWSASDSDPRGELVGLVTVGKWTHVAISFAPAGAGKAFATFEVAGTPRAQREVPSEGAVANPSLFLGARSGGSRTNIHYDNVIIDAH